MSRYYDYGYEQAAGYPPRAGGYRPRGGYGGPYQNNRRPRGGNYSAGGKPTKTARKAPSVPIANLILLSGDPYKGSEHAILNPDMDFTMMNGNLNCGTNNFHVSLSIQHRDWQNEGKHPLELQIGSKADIAGFHVFDVPEDEVAAQVAEFEANAAELEALRPKKETKKASGEAGEADDAEKEADDDTEKAGEKAETEEDKPKKKEDSFTRRPYKYRAVITLKKPMSVKAKNDTILTEDVVKDIRVIIMEFREPIGDAENKMSAVIAKALGEKGPLGKLDVTTVWGGPQPKEKKDGEPADEDDAETTTLEEANTYMNIVVDEFVAVSRENDRKNSVICQCKHGCERHMQLRRLARHESTHCQFRPTKCRYCEEEFARNQLVEHQQDECQKYHVPCKNANGQYGCQVRPERQLLDEHVVECEHEVVDCPYIDFGCKERIKRRNVTQHAEGQVADHLQKLVDSHKGMMSEFEVLKTQLESAEQAAAKTTKRVTQKKRR